MTPDSLNNMHTFNIIIGIIAVIILIIIAIVLLMMRTSNNIEEDEFPFIGNTINPNDSNWFHSFDDFKNKTNKIAKKDAKTKNYLNSRKDNNDSGSVNIHTSSRDRKDAGKDATSDLQSG